MRVVVDPYDPDWPAAFERVRAELIEALAGIPIVAIEHVGSTSVPGLAAKPIIDADVVVERPAVLAAAMALERTGYVSVGDLGIADRFAFRAPDADPRRNIYVVVTGSLPLRNHLGVRDVLRSDPELRDRYALLKRALTAREYADLGGYVQDKTALLAEILERAGLTDEERSLIAAQNAA